MEDKIWYLKEINALKTLSQEQQMQLGSYCSMTRFAKNEVVYLPGDVNNIYLLKKGSIKLVSQKKDQEFVIKDVLEKGEIFGKCFGGENGELGEQAIALEDSMVCYLSFNDWQKFMKENLDLNFSILKWAGFRIKRLERRMESLYFKPAIERVKDILFDLATRLGKKDAATGKITIPVHLSHEEFGQLTGCSRQNVTAILNEMRDKGYIDYSRQKLVILKAIEQFSHASSS
ncbi:MAG: Crp/Fnr family transcriptional regulator [Bacteroidota bacterium]